MRAEFQSAEDKAECWRWPREFFVQSASWLPRVGVPANAVLVKWSEATGAVLALAGCMLILDRPGVLLALRFIQGCAEQHLVDQPSQAKRFVLHAHFYKSAVTSKHFCQKYKLELTAAYSTSRPVTTW